MPIMPFQPDNAEVTVSDTAVASVVGRPPEKGNIIQQCFVSVCVVCRV